MADKGVTKKAFSRFGWIVGVSLIILVIVNFFHLPLWAFGIVCIILIIAWIFLYFRFID